MQTEANSFQKKRSVNKKQTLYSEPDALVMRITTQTVIAVSFDETEGGVTNEGFTTDGDPITF